MPVKNKKFRKNYSPIVAKKQPQVSTEAVYSYFDSLWEIFWSGFDAFPEEKKKEQEFFCLVEMQCLLETGVKMPVPGESNLGFEQHRLAWYYKKAIAEGFLTEIPGGAQ